MPPSISVVIPAYNEERRLPPTLERVAAYIDRAGYCPAEILVVNDGSSDKTAVATRKFADGLQDSRLRIAALDNPGNRGKGYSIRHGMLAARHDWTLFTDADLSAPIEELPKLFAAVADGEHQIAIGSRAVDRSLIGAHQPLFREYSGRFFNLCVRLAAGLPFGDTQCGFKLFSREAAQAIFARQRLERFGFDVEILYIARKLGFRIAEVPVRWDDVPGTKVRLQDGLEAFGDLARVRWNDWRGRYR